MKPINVAVLITCHNRKEYSLKCLNALYSQVGIDKVNMQVYLVDDGSMDGTGNAVHRLHPKVNVLQGNGSLFWSGGMRLAFTEAMKMKPDYYFWLNDDTFLHPNAIRFLLQTAQEIMKREGVHNIIVGSSRDPVSGQHTYGGRIRKNKKRLLDFRPIVPTKDPQQCDMICGNCVLIPEKVVHILGNISSDFTHSMGDTDYGLRANANGVRIWVAPGYLAECSRGPLPLCFNPKMSLKKRLDHLRTPKGLLLRERIIFAKRHLGIRWPLYIFKLYMRVLFPNLWVRLGK
ncbi:MAG: glycosyltransferase family 2 protein [Deltaproteobacteria bacterium]|nr:glycosyltransferase family 2 protein [Deltaproteobacteria bacterium]